MRERSEQILRIACLVLAALLLYQFVQVILRSNPLRGVRIPALPSLAADTIAPASVKAANAPAPVKSTNTAASKEAAKSGTNIQASAQPGASTNVVVTNAAPQTATNVVLLAAAPVKTQTDAVPAGETAGKGSVTPANADPLQKATNAIAPLEAGKGATNPTTTAIAARPDTNAAARAAKATPGGAIGPAGAMAMGPSAPARPGKPAELAPAIKARVDRISDSEIFGPVMRPLPMALLGIAGNTAFLRSPSGQTGLVKEGDQLGELKLLKIGVNRVLVEQDGEKKELMIFSGYGGESLLPKTQEGAK